jgi:aminoglycoside N3'-acetyltransferase
MDDYLDQLAREVIALVDPFEVVVVYSDFRFLFARPDIVAQRSRFMQGLFNRLNVSGKTFLTPSYSYTAQGEFHVERTRTNTSAFSNWLVKAPETTRSEHPIFSYVGFGAQIDLLRSVGKSAFGEGSLYDRLRSVNAGFLHLGRPVVLGNSMVHHVEHMCGASYRFNKTFSTKVYNENAYVATDYTAFVRRRDVDNETFVFRFDRAAEALEQANVIALSCAVDDMPYLASYPLDKARRIMVDMFHSDPTSFVSSEFQQY